MFSLGPKFCTISLALAGVLSAVRATTAAADAIFRKFASKVSPLQGQNSAPPKRGFVADRVSLAFWDNHPHR